MENRYEIAVVGGGVAGCAAAVSAAREGKRTVLFERSLTLGGLATNGLVNYFEPLCDGLGRQLIYGIAEEMLKRTVAIAGSDVPPVWQSGTDEERRAASTLPKNQSRYISHFTPALCSLALIEWLKAEGVEIVFDALLTEVMREGDAVSGLKFATQNGYETFTADCYIDATGSAEVFHRGGFETADGTNAAVYLAHTAGESAHLRMWNMWGDSAAFFAHKPFENYPGTTRESINRMVQEGQLELYRKLASGELTEDVVALPSMPQFRTVRRIIGRYTLTEADENRRFEDSLGVGGHFLKRGVWYEIPYRALVSTAENVVAAGRIISADGDAWNATRVIPIAALTGELSGLISARAIEKKSAVYDLDYLALSKKANARGLLLHGE